MISFHKVKKSYFLQEDRTFKEFLPSLLLGNQWAREHIVFEDLSFSIEKGETVGIIGKNGAGKSTLLKLIAGVTYPNKGTISVKGKVAPLIELGAGFHHELSGYENIYLNAAILGMHKREIDACIDDIVAFSELKEFIHVPVKRYSSGMYMRLGFSVAVHSPAPILLIDEVLAVGDVAFQEKCLEKLEQQRVAGKTIVFISHDEKAVAKFCKRVILLSQGKIVADDQPKKVLEIYHDLIKKLN